MRINLESYSSICEAQTAFGLQVQRWTSRDVVNWLSGLNDCILQYADRFLESNVDGRRLIRMTASDLQDIGVRSVGAQRTVTRALSRLCHLCYDMDTENLQSLMSSVSVQARNLCNEAKRWNENSKIVNLAPFPTNLLTSIASLADRTNQLISWLNRPPFSGDSQYSNVRSSFLTLSTDIVKSGLSGSHRRDVDVKRVANDMQILCTQLISLCDQLIESANDHLVIQTAYLDRAEVNRQSPHVELGLQLETTSGAAHLVKEVKFRSPADLCRKFDVGDEIVDINGQTVIGWRKSKVMALLSSYKDNLRLSFLLKKCPKDSWNIYKTTPSTPKMRKLHQPQTTAPPSPSSSTANGHNAVGRRRSSSFSVGPKVVVGRQAASSITESKSNTPNSPLSPLLLPTLQVPGEVDGSVQRRATVSGSEKTRNVIGSPTLKRLSLHVNRKSSLVPVAKFPSGDQRQSVLNEKMSRPTHFVFGQSDGRRRSAANKLTPKYSTSSASSVEGGDVLANNEALTTSEDEVFNDATPTLNEPNGPSFIRPVLQQSLSTTSKATIVDTSIFPPDFSEVTVIGEAQLELNKDEWSRDRLKSTAEVKAGDKEKSLESPLPILGPGGPICLEGRGFSSLPHSSQKKVTKFFGENPSEAVYKMYAEESDDSCSSSSDGARSHMPSTTGLSESPISSSFRLFSPKKMLARTSSKEKATKARRSNDAWPDPDYGVAVGSPMLRGVRRIPSGSKAALRDDDTTFRKFSSDDDDLRNLILVPCRSFGANVDFASWVYRTRFSLEKRNTKWAKRWLVLKDDILYFYHSPSEMKAEGVVWLPGCLVCPAGPEYKTKKKNVFQIHSSDVCFCFYCSQKEDMIKWLNKLGLAAIQFNRTSGPTKYAHAYFFPGLLPTQRLTEETKSGEQRQSGDRGFGPNVRKFKTLSRESSNDSFTSFRSDYSKVKDQPYKNNNN